MYFSLISGLAFAKKPDYVYNQVTNGSPNKVIGKILNLPHNYEFDEKENPNGYWWCLHTTLKSGLEAFGYKKSLTEIHQKFLEVAPGVYTETDNCGNTLNEKWCGYITYHLML